VATPLKFFRVLGSFARNIRNAYPIHWNLLYLMDSKEFESIVILSKEKAEIDKLSKVFQKLKLINHDEKLRVTRNTTGTHGLVFLINDKYAIKIFKAPNTTKYPDAHGYLAESNRALYIKKSIPALKERKITDLHFADLKNGYMLSEHIDMAAQRVYGNNIPSNANSYMYRKDVVADIEKKCGLKHSDWNTDGNVVNGILVDLGGLYIGFRHIHLRA
jgi:hypothetical protein